MGLKWEKSHLYGDTSVKHLICLGTRVGKSHLNGDTNGQNHIYLGTRVGKSYLFGDTDGKITSIWGYARGNHIIWGHRSLVYYWGVSVQNENVAYEIISLDLCFIRITSYNLVVYVYYYQNRDYNIV